MPVVRFKCPGCEAPLKKSGPLQPSKRLECPRCGHRFFQPSVAETGKQEALPNAEHFEKIAASVSSTEEPETRWPEVPGYTIVGELGQGGCAVVYKARQTNLGRFVALKMILEGTRADPETVARFRTEAQAVAQLQHPHIVQVYEVGRHQGLDFLSLEYVDGPTLAKRLASSPQPVGPAAELVETLARAVHSAHLRGIVHRDLKPANVLLALPEAVPGTTVEQSGAQVLYGVPKIADFGLAKLIDADSSHTRTGIVMGTPCYMAPEQALGRSAAIGPASDTYALGVILYEMLTGRPPFRGATALETITMLLDDEPPPVRELHPSVPRDLETICHKCLNKEAHKRYPSALALADDLHHFRLGEPIQARAPGSLERAWRWCKHYPVAAGLLASTILFLVVGLWFLSALSDQMVRTAALESAAQQSDMLTEVNNSYADIVRRAQAGKLEVTHDYANKPAAIPIPATFTIELGQQISDKSETGMQVRVYSAFPFRSRTHGGPKDAFERDAWERLRDNPDKPVYVFEEYKGRPVLRYATARKMEATCVRCHNTHPDSPKTDWKVGDVRGVVEIIHPLDQDAARTRRGLQGAFFLIAVVCASLLGLSGLALFVGKVRRRRAEPKL
jgi:serine/threonine protein kinase